MDIQSAINDAGGASKIASELGIDEATAQSGINALLPHVVNGMENPAVPAAAGDIQSEADAAAPAPGGLGGLGGLFGGLAGGAGGGLLSSVIGAATGGLGNQILGQIFGSKDASREVAADASQKSGVDPSVLKKILPILAAMVAMHFYTQRNQSGGSGGAAPATPGSGGLLGSILGT